MLSFKPTFSLSSFTFIKTFVSSCLLSAIRVVSSAYLKLLIFLLAVLIPACVSSSLAFHMMYSAYFPGGSDDKSVWLQHERPGFDPWVGKIFWRRKQQPTPVLLPDGWRSLVGYSPWDCRVGPDWATSLSLFWDHKAWKSLLVLPFLLLLKYN